MSGWAARGTAKGGLFSGSFFLGGGGGEPGHGRTVLLYYYYKEAYSHSFTFLSP